MQYHLWHRQFYHKIHIHIRGGFRTASRSKVELFVIIVNGFQPLTIITKSSTLDAAAVLDLPLHMINQNMKIIVLKITVWLGKAFYGFTRLNPISSYGKLSYNAFGDRIIILFIRNLSEFQCKNNEEFNVIQGSNNSCFPGSYYPGTHYEVFVLSTIDFQDYWKQIS